MTDDNETNDSTPPFDPELDVIGVVIAAALRGDEHGIDSKAWRRVRDYAISILGQREERALKREADERAEKLAEGKRRVAAEKEAEIQRDPTKDPNWHVLGRRTR